MRLTQRTPEARQAYVDGYRSALSRASLELRQHGLECAGGDGDKLDPSTGKRWGESWFQAAEVVERMMPKGEIIETYEMK